jgi:hypothetical protein
VTGQNGVVNNMYKYFEKGKIHGLGFNLSFIKLSSIYKGKNEHAVVHLELSPIGIVYRFEKTYRGVAYNNGKYEEDFYLYDTTLILTILGLGIELCFSLETRS